MIREDKIVAIYNSRELARHFLAGQQENEQRAYAIMSTIKPREYLALLRLKYRKHTK